MSLLGQRLLEVHDALSAADLPHAFGGAIALAYCTHEPRGTRDLDVNVFVLPERAKEVFAALPADVTVTGANVATAERDGQARVWWEDTPIDVFLDVHPFHAEVADNVRHVAFEGREIPVLDCTALTVFKALLDRPKDWVDIDEMAMAEALNLPRARAWLERLLGAESPIAQRLRSLS
ncbi:MAG: hypothetical protein ACTHM1_09970 [Solirubrobacteraceae bacterium]